MRGWLWWCFVITIWSWGLWGLRDTSLWGAENAMPAFSLEVDVLAAALERSWIGSALIDGGVEGRQQKHSWDTLLPTLGVETMEL